MQHIRDGCAVSFRCNAGAKQRALMSFHFAGILTFRFLPHREKTAEICVIGNGRHLSRRV